MEQPIQHRSLFFPNLEGLRFLAFFSVFIFHCSFLIPAGSRMAFLSPILVFLSRNGASGVNFFFVLSGFLISFLLLKEEQVYGKIHLIHFYVRRMLRIWPLYYLTLFIGFVAYPFFSALSGNPVRETASPLAYLFFMGNFNILAKGPPYSGALWVLWSVAVEEQFYLVWPLLLMVVRKNRIWLFLPLIIGSVIFRCAHADDPSLLTYHPLSLMGDFAIGGLLAWGCLRAALLPSNGLRQYKKIGIFLYSLLTLFLIFQDRIFISAGLIVFQRLIMGLLFAFVIFDQTYSPHPFFEMRRNRLFSDWGKYTYGLYCLHVPALALVVKLFSRAGRLSPAGSILIPVTGFALALALAYLSFHFFESPFLAAKRRFGMASRVPKKIPPENQGEQNN